MARRIWLDITGIRPGSDAAVLAVHLTDALRRRPELELVPCRRTPGLEAIGWTSFQRRLGHRSISRLRLPDLATLRRMARRLPNRGRAALGRFVRLQMAAFEAWRVVIVRAMQGLWRRSPVDRVHPAPGDVVAMLAPSGDAARFAGLGCSLAFLAAETLVLQRTDWVSDAEAGAAAIWVRQTLPLVSKVIVFSPQTARLLARIGSLPEPAMIAGAACPGRPPAPAHTGARPFVLAASVIGEAGQTRQLLLAWRILIDRMPPGTVPILQLAGPLGALATDILEQLRNSRLLDGHVRLIAYPGPDQMTELAHHCLFAIAPAPHCAWGRATLDSLAAGAPCLSMFDHPAAHAIDASDVTGLVAAVTAWLESPPVRPRPEARDWDAVAADVARVLVA